MQGTGLISSLPYCRILNEIRRLRNRKIIQLERNQILKLEKKKFRLRRRNNENGSNNVAAPSRMMNIHTDFILQFIAAVIGNNLFLNEDQKNVKIVNEPVYLTGSFHCGRLTRLATSLGAVV